MPIRVQMIWQSEGDHNQGENLTRTGDHVVGQDLGRTLWQVYIWNKIVFNKRALFFINKDYLFIVSNLYPSSHEEWQPIKCILGFFDVVYGAIGEL